MVSKSKLVILAALAVFVVSCGRDPQKLKQQYMADGDKYFAQKDYPEAIIQYRNAVAQDGAFGEGRMKLAAAYEATGDVRNALREYVRAADLLPDNVDAQAHAAKMLLAAGQYPEAKTRALAALAKDPKNINGLITLGNALAGLKDIDGAITQLNAAIDSQPSIAFSYANLGLLEMQKGDTTAAENTFKRAIELDPKSPDAHLNLGSFYWASGNAAQAEKEIKNAVELAPQSPEANRMLATFYLTYKRNAEAERYLKAYADTVTDVSAKLALADFYLGNQKLQESIDLLQQIRSQKDGFSPATLRLASIDFQAGRHADAYAKVEEVLKQNANDQEAVEAKARFSIAEGKWDEGLKLADSVVARNPQAETSHFLRGLALEGKGATDDAIKAFLRVLELAPSSIPTQTHLAQVYLSRGDTKGALDFLNRVVKAQPNSGAVHLLIGQAHLLAGDLADAEKELIPLGRSNPSSAEVHTTLARMYGAQGRTADARTEFARVLKLQPKSFLALNGLVAIDLAEKKFADARALIEPRLASDPDNGAILFLAGNSYLMMGDEKRAETLLTRVIEVDPSNIQAYGRLASIYISQHRLDEAKRAFDDVTKRQPNHVGAITMTGMILELQQKEAEARKQYQRALDLDPNAAVAANNLAWGYAQSGNDLDTALRLAQVAKSKLPESSAVNDTLGWVYYQKDLPSLAISSFQEAIKLAPSNAGAHYHLGLAYLKAGDQQKARASIEQALKLNPNFKDADDAKRQLSTIKG